MIVNVQKHFTFNREKQVYDIDYLFTNNKNGDPVSSLFLTLNVSINGAEKKQHKLNKPTSILYLSNKEIEKLIEADMTSL